MLLSLPKNSSFKIRTWIPTEVIWELVIWIGAGRLIVTLHEQNQAAETACCFQLHIEQIFFFYIDMFIFIYFLQPGTN